MKPYLIFLNLLIATLAQAQFVERPHTCSSGKVFTANNYTLSNTIGEAITATYTKSYTANQGFQQSEVDIVNSTIRDEADKINLSVFPVPANNNIYVQSSFDLNNIPFQITDMSGKVLIKSVFKNSGLNEINIEGLSSGIYYFQISITEYNQFESKKIIKL